MSQYTRLPAGASVNIAASGAPGAAAPSQALQVAGTDGTNLRVLSVSSAGVLNVALASVPLPTGAATAANQVTEIASLASIDSKLTAPLSVTGPLTDVQLRATAVPISAAALPLPTGAATSALQTSGNASLSSIDGKTPALGQALMAASVPIAIASDQSAIPVTVASVPLPTGAATSALQTAGNASLVSIDSKLTSPLAVTGPLTDTELRASAVPVSAASLPLPTGAATAANQATEIASLASIDTKLTSPLAVTGPLTDTQLRASAVPVSIAASVAVTGPLTDTELRATPVPISGTVSTGGLTDTQLRASAVPVSLTSTTITGSVAVTGPLTDTQLRASGVPVLTSPDVATTTALANVSGSASSVSIIGSNSARKGLYIFNDSTAILYLKLSSNAASTTSYTVQMPSNSYYELPSSSAIYTGEVTGIWASATGAARITEVS